MASCPKCGKRRLRKDAEKRRFCRHCGLLRSPANMCRSGHVAQQDGASDFESGGSGFESRCDLQFEGQQHG